MTTSLDKIRKILIDCNNKIEKLSFDFREQDCAEMLTNVFGEYQFMKQIKLLLNMVVVMYHRESNMESNMNRLNAENRQLKEKIDSYEKLIGTYNKNYLQRVRVKTGEKIAYKNEANKDKILELIKQGLSKKDIAEQLNISKSTLWRRLKNSK